MINSFSRFSKRRKRIIKLPCIKITKQILNDGNKEFQNSIGNAGQHCATKIKNNENNNRNSLSAKALPMR